MVTVEPISSAILKIELADSRKAEDWKKHWNCLKDNGYYAVYLVSDEGKGICTAHQQALADIIRQSDTYHAIAHQLGYWVKNFETAAYRAIKQEYDRYDKLDSAKSEPVINKKIGQYEQAQKITKEKIQIYEDYRYVYSCLIEELSLFDDSGNLRDPKKAETHITTGLDLLEAFENSKLTKTVNKVRRTMPNLFHYFDRAQSIVSDLMWPYPVIRKRYVPFVWLGNTEKEW